MDNLLTMMEALHIHMQKEKQDKTPHVKVNSESRTRCKTQASRRKHRNSLGSEVRQKILIYDTMIHKTKK